MISPAVLSDMEELGALTATDNTMVVGGQSRIFRQVIVPDKRQRGATPAGRGVISNHLFTPLCYHVRGPGVFCSVFSSPRAMP
ncbi:MAG: hypothetical protein GPOALKHO_000871 [Sodalis sp.]|nr:MAG: hypothetical protein GPOALKHO_000871 [Sodalis sp.]